MGILWDGVAIAATLVGSLMALLLVFLAIVGLWMRFTDDMYMGDREFGGKLLAVVVALVLDCVMIAWALRHLGLLH